MRRFLTLALCGAALLVGRAEPVCTTAAALNARACRAEHTNISFRIEGLVIARLGQPRLVLEDATGLTMLSYLSPSDAPPPPLPQPGDRVVASGTLRVKDRGDIGDTTVIVCTYETVRTNEPVTVREVALADLDRPENVMRPVRTSGLVVDALPDDFDPRWFHLILKDGQSIFVAAVPRGKAFAPEQLKDARVSLFGVPLRNVSGYRQFSGPYLELARNDDLRILAPPPEDPFDYPLLGDLLHQSPKDIARLDKRRIVGRVLATWKGDRILVQTQWDKPILVKTAERSDLPACGSQITAVGYPETDLAHIIFTRAVFKTDDEPVVTDGEPPQSVTAEEMMFEKSFFNGMKVSCRGRLVRIRGTVIGISAPDSPDEHFMLQSGEYTLPVYPGADRRNATRATVGATVDVTGICMIETESYQPTVIFPRVNGFCLVMRRADDLTVVSPAPWLTPARFLTLLGALLAALVAVLLWNRTLHRLAERRGRELYAAQVDKASADLRIGERTRLAADLHDSLAQNLTGVSLEIDTAAKVADGDPHALRTHLGVASHALKSCRDELRNCIWDLRSKALDEPTMDDAIRQTLAPHLMGVEVTVRFSVPRDRISDNTAHAILKIIRELTLNGIRHGGATKVWIAGSVEDDRLLFSVRDNGSGFNPESAPGFDEGHFGLLGIRERVDEFEGDFTISSAAGKGTKATVALNMPKDSAK